MGILIKSWRALCLLRRTTKSPTHLPPTLTAEECALFPAGCWDGRTQLWMQSPPGPHSQVQSRDSGSTSWLEQLPDPGYLIKRCWKQPALKPCVSMCLPALAYYKQLWPSSTWPFSFMASLIWLARAFCCSAVNVLAWGGSFIHSFMHFFSISQSFIHFDLPVP